jgi:DNA-binding transcriptional LysR family regulator
MELRQLSQFVAVAETQNFSRAAERLGMAQPPLSVAIRKLEDEIGVSLFDRVARGVRLTDAGEAALEAARKCLREADEVASLARMAAKGEAGLLRLGFVGSATFDVLPRLIEAFSERYPNVRLDLFEAANLELLQSVTSGRLHLAIVRVPTAAPAGVRLQLIEKDVFCLALPARHPLAERPSLALADLSDEAFIGYLAARAGTLHAAMIQLCLQAGIVPRVTQEGVQVQTVIGLVASGLGIAIVPAIHAQYSTPRVVFRPIRDLPAGSEIGISVAYPTSRETAAARRFREIARALQVSADGDRVIAVPPWTSGKNSCIE